MALHFICDLEGKKKTKNNATKNQSQPSGVLIQSLVSFFVSSTANCALNLDQMHDGFMM